MLFLLPLPHTGVFYFLYFTHPQYAAFRKQFYPETRLHIQTGGHLDPRSCPPRAKQNSLLTWRLESWPVVSCSVASWKVLWEPPGWETGQLSPLGFEPHDRDFSNPSLTLPPAGQSFYFCLQPSAAGEQSGSEGWKNTQFNTAPMASCLTVAKDQILVFCILYRHENKVISKLLLKKVQWEWDTNIIP